ncbi:conjugative transposon TraJ protein [Mucilaginibacter gracilis]|uniref:Conjugative transposon TraJ protein n=1 Tax=Mucilaginibacter gracilis TaxID=423350 RepID=A0A495IVT8_9SPHI|nr:conjugative transposon protein TraJ [Mucilaginibacter gracilis]RKR80682.1 conjugative transposon TraJ protein [Mucilaginibacter gracilis]
MKKQTQKIAIMAITATLLPLLSRAQDPASGIQNMQSVLNTLYDQMIPMCSQLIGIGQGIAGFAALWYIAARVWKHIAAAEPVDFYPLLRPFVLGFCILTFPTVIALINGVLSPTVNATSAMVNNTNQAVRNILNGQEQANTQPPAPTNMNGNPDKWYQYAHPDNSAPSGTNTSPFADMFSDFGFKNMIKKMIFEILNVLFQAAALCIDVIRTFKLIVLAILGPLCFGMSVFDGFQHTAKQWLARYVNVYMWLPVANIFGAIIAKIQLNMVQFHQSDVVTGRGFDETNTLYLMFMVIGIIGYLTVPGIANYIINVGGHALFSKTSAIASMAITYGGGQALQGMMAGKAAAPPVTPASSTDKGEDNAHLKDRLSGNT